jgi:hypothetical protein
MSESLQVSVAREMNDWVRGELQALAVGANRTSLPMEEPDFDFYRWARWKVQWWRWKGKPVLSLGGQDFDWLVCDAIRAVFWKETGDERYGPFFNYYDKLKENSDYPADFHFKLCFQQRVLVFLRKRRRDRFVFDGFELVFEGSREPVDGGLSLDVQYEIQEIVQRISQDITTLFSKHRHRRLLVQVCKCYYGEGFTLMEVADRLNILSTEDCDFLPPRGGVWSTGQVERLKWKVNDMFLEYLGSCHYDDEDIGRILSSHAMSGIFDKLV